MSRLANIQVKLGVAAVMLMVLLAACSSEPKPIEYGSDQCVHCKMVITEKAFATQLVSNTGKAYNFDAIECMAAYLDENSEMQEQSTRWVHDFANPDQWIKVESAIFVQSDKIQSPMGLSLLAFNSESDMESHLKEYSGERISWSEIVQQVREKW